MERPYENNIRLLSLIYQNDTVLQDLAPFSIKIERVAGLHRACPSASLDKRIIENYILIN
jgi:hypothetical protein